MDRSILFVGIGGFLGSVARYLVSIAVAANFNSSFPLATLIVNVAGCLLIGILYGLTDRGQLMSPEMRIFLTTGFCGGFTTFSTFSYESIALAQGGEFLYLAINVALSVVLGFAATYAGIVLVRSLL
jgi:CrcB protein